jgi:hypothetical protein
MCTQQVAQWLPEASILLQSDRIVATDSATVRFGVPLLGVIAVVALIHQVRDDRHQ